MMGQMAADAMARSAAATAADTLLEQKAMVALLTRLVESNTRVLEELTAVKADLGTTKAQLVTMTDELKRQLEASRDAETKNARTQKLQMALLSLLSGDARETWCPFATRTWWVQLALPALLRAGATWLPEGHESADKQALIKDQLLKGTGLPSEIKIEAGRLVLRLL
jgi:hypothetical protein